MVMNRGHAEDSLARELERRDLQDDRNHLHQEHAAHDEQHDLLANDDSDDA
jgi:hypothetical protein